MKCPRCGSDRVFWIEKCSCTWKCYTVSTINAKFSLKTGTIMEDSPISVDKWLVALWMIVNCKNGISSCEMAKDLGITQKSAWFLNHRIRMAVHEGSIEKASGHVEADETFIGGKARNMHVAQRRRRITGTGTKDKTAVMGILERGGKIRALLRLLPKPREKDFCRLRLTSTLKPVPRCTPTSFCRTTGWSGALRSQGRRSRRRVRQRHHAHQRA